MNENVQIGNASEEAPESANMDVDGFFEALDDQVNGGILDQPSQEQTTSEPAENVTQSENTSPQNMNPVEGQDTDIENLQKRYGDSSREAKRLNEKLKGLEPYMPILDAMKEDPNLITHVRDYFEGGGQAPVSMKEQLSLDEDFIFDPDEAMSNPNSDSAKIFAATIDGVVQKRLNDSLSIQRKETERVNKESEFRKKFDMNDEQWSHFVDFAKNKSLQLDDIYYLMNKGKREQNIAKSANQEVSNQMKKTQQRPQSLASVGSQPEVEASKDDSLFDQILGIDKQLDNAFG
ncbi:MAG: hypothetical protein H8D80_01455 [Proteobacteria bacterium]|nr:hypothetical protein [Pseudomonadota bacterium]